MPTIEITARVIGNCTLYLADNKDILPTLSGIDHILSDPPYGKKETHAKHLSSVVDRKTLGFEGLTKEELIAHTQQWLDLAGRWVVFTCEWKYCLALEDAGLLVRMGIWRKPDGVPQFTGDRPGMGWEAVAVCHRKGRKRWNGGGKHGVWSFPKGKTFHPTGKPVALYSAFLTDFTDEGDTILDPFMGSGTTGVACVKLGRKFIGIEKDAAHFKTACERIAAAVREPDLFANRAVPA